MQNNQISIRLSSYIDLLRGLSAFLVLYGHIFLVFSIKDFNEILTFFSYYGFQAVLVFFVISGFLVTKSFMNNLNNKYKNLSDYYIDRIFRIHVVLIPALLFTLCIDNITLLFDPANELILRRLTIENFFGNIFLLQEIYFERYGSNGPLWSLAYEFWYYVLFPSLYVIFFSFRKKIKIVSLIIVMILFYILPISLLKYFSIWLLGAFINFIPKVIFKNFWIPFTLFSLMFIYSSEYFDLKYINFVYYFIMSSFLALSFNSLNNKNTKKLNNSYIKISNFFSNFSYSTYIIHYPILILLSSITIKVTNSSLQILIICLVCIYLISYMFYLLTEKNTNKLKKYFYLYFMKASK